MASNARPFDLLSFVLGAVVLAVIVAASVWDARRQALLRQQRKSALEELARRLGLEPRSEPKEVLAGEYRGWGVRMGFEMRDVARKNKALLPIVRLDTGAVLPRDFVAVPREWTQLLLRLGLPGIFKANHPILDKRFVFQCDFVEPGKALVNDPRSQEALARLGGGGDAGVAFIEKNQVCLAYPKQLPDEATLRQHLDMMVAVASALRVAGGLSGAPLVG